MNETDDNYIPPEVCLDKCKCGGTPKFIELDFRSFPSLHVAVCYACGYKTEGYPAQYQAMCEWNKRQRGVL